MTLPSSAHINPPQLHVYKNQQTLRTASQTDQRTDSLSRFTQLKTRSEEEDTKKMVSHKYLLPGFALCFLVDELYAFLLPDRLRLAKSTHRLSRDVSPHLSELTDLAEFMPDNGGEMTQDWDPKPAKSFTVHTSPVEHIPSPPKPQHRNNKDKRARVTVPLDRIGNSYLSSRNRKDEPEDNLVYFNE